MKKKNNEVNDFYIQKKFLKNIIARITLPLILIFLTFSCILYIYTLEQKKQVIKDCERNLNEMSSYLEEELEQIIIASNMLTLSDDFFDVFYTYNKIYPPNYFKYTQSIDALRRLRLTKDYIDSVFFMDKNNDIVIGSFGSLSTDFYFRSEKFATVYNNKEFWYNIKFTNSVLRFLPEETSVYITTKHLQPILIQRLGNYPCIYPLVVNIDKEKFAKNFDLFKPTKHTLVYAYSLELGEVLFTNTEKPKEEADFSTLMHKEKSKPREIIINDIKYELIFLQSNGNYTDGISYIMLIPQSDINTIIHSYQILGLITLIICGVLAFLASFFNTQKLYQPVQELLELLPPDITTDEFTFLKNKINKILNDNESLKSDFSAVFPNVCEKYIIDILQNNKQNYSQLRDMLEKYQFSFHYPYFTAAMIGFTFSKHMEDFTPPEQSILYKKFFDSIKYFIAGNYECYLFQIEEGKFCIIANSESQDSSQELFNNICSFQKILKVDNEYLSMFAGIGQTYENLESISKSWKEAKNAYYSVTPYSNNRIQLFENDKVTNNFSITVQEDNYIFNYLMNGDYESLEKILTNISARIGDRILSEANIQSIYNQLYYIGSKVLTNKDISETELMGNQYINFSTRAYILTPIQMYSYVTALYHSICELKSKDKKISLTEIKKYVDAHYNEDIYLETIADEFNTSAKYMSRLLKEALDMPYKQYLNYARIGKAKELLSSTNINIESIATKVGFNNRTSFIRSFKAIEGVSPSEYRNNI